MNHQTSTKRRRFLVTTTSIVAGSGAILAATPFVAYMLPSARTRNAGAPVEVDISKLEPGQQMTIEWRSKPVWILRRTPQNLKDLKQDSHLNKLVDPDSEVESQQPDYAKNDYRSIRPEYLVTLALCTHLGCVPTFRPEEGPVDLGRDWVGGYFCPCHGSRFDLAGRVFRNVPAPTNLRIPPHYFISDSIVKIGEDHERE